MRHPAYPWDVLECMFSFQLGVSFIVFVMNMPSYWLSKWKLLEVLIFTGKFHPWWSIYYFCSYVEVAFSVAIRAVLLLA